MTRRYFTDNQYLEMIENATHDYCERVARDHETLTTDELYGFVLGDNDSPAAFEALKDAIDDAKEAHDLYRAGY